MYIKGNLSVRVGTTGITDLFCHWLLFTLCWFFCMVCMSISGTQSCRTTLHKAPWEPSTTDFVSILGRTLKIFQNVVTSTEQHSWWCPYCKHGSYKNIVRAKVHQLPMLWELVVLPDSMAYGISFAKHMQGPLILASGWYSQWGRIGQVFRQCFRIVWIGAVMKRFTHSTAAPWTWILEILNAIRILDMNYSCLIWRFDTW